MASYELKSFIGTPIIGDVSLKIYDKFLTLKYNINPNIAFFYKSSNMIIIKVQDSNDIYLDFETSTECNNALIKLNESKQNLLGILTASGIDTGNVTLFSKNNLNMVSNITVNDGDLACDIPINDIPIPNSPIRVYINGVEVRVGGKLYPFDCYFSVDGVSVRSIGDERMGDKLYWNKTISGYNLDNTDLIDFVFLINVNV